MTPGDDRKEFEGFKLEVIINTPDIVIHCCPKTSKGEEISRKIHTETVSTNLGLSEPSNK